MGAFVFSKTSRKSWKSIPRITAKPVKD